MGHEFADSDYRRKVRRLKGVDYLRFGIFGQIVGLVVAVLALGIEAPQLEVLGNLTLILSSGVLVGGCAKFARFHRLHGAWAVAGLFNLPGVLLLMGIPAIRERSKKRGAGFSVIFAQPYRRDVWRMDVRVRLDETTRVGVREPIMLQLPRGARVGTAMKTLADVIPGLSEHDVPGVRYTVNGQPVDRRVELSDSDELVVSIVPAGAAAASEHSTSFSE
jgi:hypothetical protein